MYHLCTNRIMYIMYYHNVEIEAQTAFGIFITIRTTVKTILCRYPQDLPRGPPRPERKSLLKRGLFRLKNICTHTKNNNTHQGGFWC